MEKPEVTFRAGAVQASVFMNVRKVKGKEVTIPSISFQKRYLDNGEWKSTNSLSKNDAAKAILLLVKAYDYCVSSPKDQDGEEDEEEVEASV